MYNRIILGCLFFVGLAPFAFSQALVTNGLVLGNSQGSSIMIVNPNTSGTFTLELPTIPHLQPGEQQELVLKVVGTEGAPRLTFATPSTNAQAPSLNHQQFQLDETPPKSVRPKVVHAFAEIDLPPVTPQSSYVVKLDQPLVKAGAAISISPAAELPTGLYPAFAWSPIDCVVMVKFMNMGPPMVDLPAMQFSIGVINPD